MANYQCFDLDPIYYMTDIVIDQLVRCRRRSIGLQITRDARLVVRAPQRVSLVQIQELVQAKREWILRKQTFGFGIPALYCGLLIIRNTIMRLPYYSNFACVQISPNNLVEPREAGQASRRFFFEN